MTPVIHPSPLAGLIAQLGLSALLCGGAGEKYNNDGNTLLHAIQRQKIYIYMLKSPRKKISKQFFHVCFPKPRVLQERAEPCNKADSYISATLLQAFHFKTTDRE